MSAKMTPNDRFVFELCEAGLVSEVRRPLYEPGITNLLAAGIIHLEDGFYLPVDADRVGRQGRRPDGSSRLTPPGPPKPPPMGQMQVRIPQAWIDRMVASAEEHGVDKSKVLRDLLRPHFEPNGEGAAAPVAPAGERPRAAAKASLKSAAKAPSKAAKASKASPTRRAARG